MPTYLASVQQGKKYIKTVEIVAPSYEEAVAEAAMKYGNCFLFMFGRDMETERELKLTVKKFF